jgi:hypothetical protein
MRRRGGRKRIVVTTINEGNLGAWLLRCNPEGVRESPDFIENGAAWITDRCVVENYRSKMMKPGDLVVLWMSGNGRRMARGIWGVGHVTSYVQDKVPDAADADEDRYWLRKEARLAIANSIGVDIPLFRTPLADAALKAAGIDDLEVQRQPQGSNPSWISREQLARLEPLLPEWPGAPGEEEEIIVGREGGAGSGTALTNRVVKAAAVAAVRDLYEARNWNIDDVSRDKLGWDLTCTSPEGEVARVEVNGVRGDRPPVLLTADEIRSAGNDDSWVLAVVTRALSAPRVTEFDAATVVAAAHAYVYRPS